MLSIKCSRNNGGLISQANKTLLQTQTLRISKPYMFRMHRNKALYLQDASKVAEELKE